ncbi:MAG: tautomerase family protein [bacterium]|nr:tautomerase family protein [bacterium]
MPLIRIDLWKGTTTIEQKGKLVKEITDTVILFIALKKLFILA